jgi:putative ABC transport system substrate-binding protein
VSVFTARLGSKRLGLLHEMVPSAATIAILVNPTNPDTEDEANDIQQAAQGLGVQVFVVRADKTDDLDDAFTTVVQRHAGAVIVGSDTFLPAVAAKFLCSPPVGRSQQCGSPASKSRLVG